MGLSKKLIKKVLDQAGIKINGSEPFDIEVKNEKFYTEVLRRGTLGAGESYMKEYWNSDQLAETARRIMTAPSKIFLVLTPNYLSNTVKNYIFNLGKPSQSFEVGEVHYDLDYDLFEPMLGISMVYSCGYWKEAEDLEDAQRDKLDLVCQKLELQPGMTVLEIGCGWGSFAKYAAERYGVQVTGITVAKKQAEYARKLCEGLPVSVMLKDWHELIESPMGKFDRVVSIAMLEAVWWKDYSDFMKVAREHLKAGGKFLLHSIGKNSSVLTTDPWIQKYIFPNGLIPPRKKLEKAIRRYFRVWDWHQFGSEHYAQTLAAWHERFQTAWPRIEQKYGKEFKRMWEYYLQTCEAAFRAELLDLWQIVMAKEQVPDNYKKVR